MDQLREDPNKNIKSEQSVETQIDPSTFEHIPHVLYESKIQDFSVTDPVEKDGHIKYTVKMKDAQGAWDGQRRYNEFYVLNEALKVRWPWCQIPILPPKIYTSGKDKKYLEERRYYLDRYIKKMAKYEYVLNSDEFKLFSRPQAQVGKSLQGLQKMSIDAQIERFEESMDIKLINYDQGKKDQFKNDIIEFTKFYKKCKKELQEVLNKLIKYSNTYLRDIKNYKNFHKMLIKYESHNLMHYVEGDESQFVFWRKEDDEDEIEMQIEMMVDNMISPYGDLYLWIKGELQDLEALNAVVQRKETLESAAKKLQANWKSNETTVKDLTERKKTLKTITKSEKDIGGLEGQIDSAKKEELNYTYLAELFSVYIAESLIPVYKEQHKSQYEMINKQFNLIEINNS